MVWCYSVVWCNVNVITCGVVLLCGVVTKLWDQYLNICFICGACKLTLNGTRYITINFILIYSVSWPILIWTAHDAQRPTI